MERGCTPLKRSLRPVRSMYYVYIYIYIYTTIHLQDATSMFSLNELFLTRKRRGGGGGGIFTRWKYERNSRGISGRVSVTCSAGEDGWNAWRFFFFFRSFSTASATTTVFWTGNKSGNLYLAEMERWLVFFQEEIVRVLFINFTSHRYWYFFFRNFVNFTSHLSCF